MNAEAVRDGDKDRYLASLFAPDGKRPHLLALYAFNLKDCPHPGCRERAADRVDPPAMVA